jgi:peptidoglycan/xylan/chitin deacetylase (PgdA/CDA1 family)
MYFNKSNRFYHGIMFHHFHDDNIHTKGQGSISKDDFYKIIQFIGRKNILDADIFFDKYKKNKLKENEVCITFDDALKCQIDIALPLLDDLKIKSFFFVYTSIFEENPDTLEIFRHFRNNYFNSIDDFYINFYKVLNKDLSGFFRINEKKIYDTRVKFPFYSTEDVKFRLVRDYFLTKTDYDKIIISMMDEKKIKSKDFHSILFFSKEDLKNLNKLGHLIGLHSHNHPTKLEILSYDEQKNEYEKCISIISKIIGKSQTEIKWMSHPCGSYNNDTLHILENLDIELGFKQHMLIEPEKGMKSINNTHLEISRVDHTNILRRIS